MKKIVLLLALTIGFVAATQAQSLVDVKPYGSKGSYELTPTNDTISVTPKYSASIYTMPVDTNVVLQADVSVSNPCNLLWFKLTADAIQRTVTFGSGLEAAASTVAANKSRTWGFVYVGDRYVLIHESAEY